MGGGGSSPAAAAESQVLQVPVTQYSAFMPGQKEALLAQIGQGYGVPDAGLIGMDYYRDMNVPLVLKPGDVTAYMKNIGLTPAENSSKATPAVATPSGSTPAAAIPSTVPSIGIGSTNPDSWYLGIDPSWGR